MLRSWENLEQNDCGQERVEVHIGGGEGDFKVFSVDPGPPHADIVLEHIERRCGKLPCGKGPMVSQQNLKTEIDALVRTRIRSGEVVKVIVDRDENFQGDDIINVKVIYDSKSKKLDPQEVVGLTRVVRSRLHELDEFAFPMFYYICLLYTSPSPRD